MKSIPFFVSIFVLTALFCLSTFAQSVATGVVTGSIYDLTGEAVVLGTKITIKGSGIERSGFPNPDDGRYEFEVPAGIYNITTEHNWWFPVKRSEIEIRAGERLVVNLYPALRVSAIQTEITTSGFRDIATYLKAPEHEILLSKKDVGANGFIEFQKKKTGKGGVEYRSAKWSRNSLTIVAERIYYDNSKAKLKAQGKVLIDDGGKRSRTEKYVIKL